MYLANKINDCVCHANCAVARVVVCHVIIVFVALTEICPRRLSAEVVTQRLAAAHVFSGNCHFVTKGNNNKTSLCYNIVYYYNGA